MACKEKKGHIAVTIEGGSAEKQMITTTQLLGYLLHCNFGSGFDCSNSLFQEKLYS